MELTYTKVGDYFIPDLTLGNQPEKAWGSMAGCVKNSWRSTTLAPTIG